LTFAQNAAERLGAERVVLFGSRARGDWLLDSDYDFIVVSASFEGLETSERWRRAYACFPEGRGGLQALCYTPEAFERKRREIGIVSEALKTGTDLLKAGE
jgi:hypothetical protein